MNRLLLIIGLVLASAVPAHADDYLVCVLAGINTKCPGNAKLPPGFAVAVGSIPNLPASKITSGVFALARIPTGIPATSIGLGTVNDTIFDYLSDVTGPIQLQLNTISGTVAGAVLVSGVQIIADQKTFTTPPVFSAASILSGTVANSALANSSITVGVGSGLSSTCSPVALGSSCTVSLAVVPIANGGTGATSFLARQVLAGPTSGGAAAPTLRILSGSDIDYSSGTPPFSAGTTVKDALDALVGLSSSQVAVSFSVVPGAGDVGKIYRLGSSGLAVVAQGDSETNAKAVRGAYQGNAGYVSGGLGGRLQILLEPGLGGLLTPAPGMPIFVSVNNAGKGTTEDPIDAGVVDSYSLMVGVIEDASGYGATGMVTAQWLLQLPVGPLGTASSPPSDPPYYVDSQVFTCPSGVSAGQLLALTTTNLTLQLADASLQRPAFGRVAQVLTATTCRLYAIDLVIAGGGAAAGTQYYLSTAGNETTTAPALGSGVTIQHTSLAVSTSAIRSAIDLHTWDANLP